MTIVRIGASKNYSDNWELAFGRKKAGGTATVKRAQKPAAKKGGKKASKRR